MPTETCDRCDKPAVAFYTISVAFNGVDGDGDLEEEQRCEQHRRDREPRPTEVP